ncbi:MAG: hypothetical protein R3F23_03365 [Verrucomicrobiia bacterium]
MRKKIDFLLWERSLKIIILFLGLAKVVHAETEKKYTLTTFDQRFEITTTNLSLTHQLLLTVEQAGKDFEALMGEKGDWKYPIHLSVFSGVKGFERQVKISHQGLIFNLLASPEALGGGEFFSALSELLCYELSVRDLKGVQNYETLPVLDFWLVDGIGQNLNRVYHEDYLRVVKGVTDHQAAPTLLTVHSWSKPSEDRLERWYQKAFNFWLVRQLTFRKADREALGQWLRQASRTETERTTYWTNMVVGGKWWSTALRRSVRQPHEVFLNYETTQQQLETILQVEFEKDKKSYSLVHWDETPKNAEFFLFLRKEQQALWQLMERGDAFYQPVIMAYYEAFSILLGNNKSQKTFLDQIQFAKNLALDMQTQRQKMNDYLNWFEVTQYPLPPEIEFNDYFDWMASAETQEVMANLRQRADPFSILNWQR